MARFATRLAIFADDCLWCTIYAVEINAPEVIAIMKKVQEYLPMMNVLPESLKMTNQKVQ